MSQPLGRAAASEGLEVSAPQQAGPLTVIQLRGRLDARAAQDLKRHCSAVREGGKHHLGLELSQVSFVSSSGLGVFLAVTEEYKEAGGTLHLVAPSEAVSAVIKLLNLHRFLTISPTVQAAVDSLKA